MPTAERWLRDSLQYQFSNLDLFTQALTHRSAAGASNERLEFLGDAVLDFVISIAIYEARPGADEGDLSRLRAWLVNDASLAGLARDLGLGEHLVLGGGERKSGGHRRDSILADALEAIFGAVFLDGGFDAASAVIHTCYDDKLADLPDVAELRDPKTRLQEWLQARGRGLPTYELLTVTGKAHNQRFEVSCSVTGDDAVGKGQGTSRRLAEQDAARQMLEHLAGESST